MMSLLPHINLSHACIGKEDFHYADFKNLDSKGLERECCQTSCSDQLKLHGMSCGEGYKVKGDQRSNTDWSHMEKGRLKEECCEEMSEECKKSNAEHKPPGEWKQRAAVLNNVTYLDHWGKNVLKAKTASMRFSTLDCKNKNKQFKSEEQCRQAEERCCFGCDKMDCGSDLPLISTCADNKPSAFMKKFGVKECSTSGSVDFGMMTDWCASACGAHSCAHVFSKGAGIHREFRFRSGRVPCSTKRI